MKQTRAMSPDFTHLFRVARIAMEKGDRGPAEQLLRTYRVDGVRHGNVEARRKAQKLAVLLANGSTSDITQLLPGDINPWAAAQKLRHREKSNINFNLTDQQVRAAESIQRIFEETTRALSAWCMPMNSIQVDTSKKSPNPWLNLPAWVSHERMKVYLPWLQRWSNIHVIKRPHQTLSACELVALILVEGHSVNAIGRSWRADPKRLRRRFRQALDGYAEQKRTARQERDIVEGGL